MWEKIKEVFRVLKDKDVETAIKELQKALILADIDIKTVKELSDRIRERIQEEKEKTPGISTKTLAYTIIYNELKDLLESKRPFPLIEQKIMLVGVNGSGKTTTAVKLARWLQKRGLDVYVMTTDKQRPAAREQLIQLAQKAGVKYVEKIPDRGAVVIDTAGRHSLDEELMNELKTLKELYLPDKTLLVVPADMGRIAGREAERLQEEIGIDGVIITKLDGSAKGGGAIVACKKAGVPVYFVGTGEKVEDFDYFDADRFLKGLLGISTVEELLKNIEKEEKIPETFNVRVFHDQLMKVSSMGTLDKIFRMIGIDAPVNLIEDAEKKLKKYDAIYKSMTEEERDNPHIINESRMKRIAKGSGTTLEDVRAFMRDYWRAEKLFKKLKKGKLRGLKVWRGFSI